MGDVVLATSAFAPLRKAGFELAVVTKNNFAELLRGHPDVREVYAFDKSDGEGRAKDAFFAWYEAQGFAAVLDLQDSWRTRVWRNRLRRHAPVFVARKERFREWMILVARLRGWFGFGHGGRARKFWRAAIDVTARVGRFSQSGSLLTRLHVSEEERAAVDDLIPAGDFVVLLPASAWPGKEWPYFPELASVLARRVPVVVLGGAGDTICDVVAGNASAVNKESRSLRGQTDLRQSLAVIARARWVIGNDTGMVHAAEALGKDVAMIEGPTHPSLGFSPHRERSLTLGLPLLCRPCSKSGRICWRFGTRKCLYGLRVQDVVAELRARGYPC